MSEWKEVRLIDISSQERNSFIDGDWIETPFLSELGIRLIQTGNIGRGIFRDNNKKYISEESFLKLKCKEVKTGDILICRLADPIGRSCKVPTLPTKNITSVDVTIFRVDSTKYFDDYILQLINTDDFLIKANEVAGGSTRQRISRSKLGNLRVSVPASLIKQKEIAKILSTCDTIISQTQSAIAKYKAIKQGLLHDLFTRGLDATGRLRPTWREAPELYKASELGMIPGEWESCKMGKYVLANLYGPRFDAKDYAENGNVKTIRGTDFTKEGEILYEQAPKAKLPNVLINAHKLNDGDIVIVTTANCGLTAVFREPINDVDFIPSAYSVKYRFANNVNPYFIKFFMSTGKAIRQVNKYVRQGTLGNLPGSDILRFEMFFPSIEEQNTIAERINSLENKLQSEETLLQKYQSIKRGLMGDLLGGNAGLGFGGSKDDPD